MGSKPILVAYLLAILVGVDATIGVNWGRESAQRLVPSTVVDLLLQNGVKEARVYSCRPDLLRAFEGSGIGLSLAAHNIDAFASYDHCKNWILTTLYYLKASNVRRIYIGNKPFVVGLTNKDALKKNIETLRYLQSALNDAGLGDQIKALFSFSGDLLKPNITKPSQAEFRDEIKEEMATVIEFYKQNGSPFVFEMIPNSCADMYGLDPLFAFVGESTQVVRDINRAVYTNFFEFLYDSFVWALIKIDAPQLKVVVGQVGWPTDGYQLGNASTAERFFKGLLPFVASDKGTPLRPGAPIDTFVHALTDENRLPHQFMRHWGIYRSNGKPKFKIDFSGQGRDIYPTSVKQVMRMPKRWCVFNGDRADFQRVKAQVDYACAKSDCSSLRIGGSCSHLSFEKNVSYVFNTYFQFEFQDEKACDLDGLSYITVENPSTDECMFPVEVVQGQQENYVATGAQPGYAAVAKLTKPKSKAHHLPSYSNCVISLLLLSIFGALFCN